MRPSFHPSAQRSMGRRWCGRGADRFRDHVHPRSGRLSLPRCRSHHDLHSSSSMDMERPGPRRPRRIRNGYGTSRGSGQCSRTSPSLAPQHARGAIDQDRRLHAVRLPRSSHRSMETALVPMPGSDGTIRTASDGRLVQRGTIPMTPLTGAGDGTRTVDASPDASRPHRPTQRTGTPFGASTPRPPIRGDRIRQRASDPDLLGDHE